MRVHNYVLVDFKVLGRSSSILLGGIEVSIDYTINDERYPDKNYGYDPFYLAPGTHILDGEDALRFRPYAAWQQRCVARRATAAGH